MLLLHLEWWLSSENGVGLLGTAAFKIHIDELVGDGGSHL